MKNKTIAYWIYGAIAATVFGGAVDAGDDFFTIVALVLIIAGGLAAYRLYNIAD